jgi:hypothetical protein
MPARIVGPMNKWRSAFFVTLVLSLLGIGGLAYRVIDQATTLTYVTDGYGRTEKDLQVLADTFPRDTYTRKDIVVVLRKIDPKAFIVETKCAVQLNGLRFEFNATGQLMGINPKAESSPEYECPGT